MQNIVSGALPVSVFAEDYYEFMNSNSHSLLSQALAVGVLCGLRAKKSSTESRVFLKKYPGFADIAVHLIAIGETAGRSIRFTLQRKKLTKQFSVPSKYLRKYVGDKKAIEVGGLRVCDFDAVYHMYLLPDFAPEKRKDSKICFVTVDWLDTVSNKFGGLTKPTKMVIPRRYEGYMVLPVDVMTDFAINELCKSRLLAYSSYACSSFDLRQYMHNVIDTLVHKNSEDVWFA